MIGRVVYLFFFFLVATTFCFSQEMTYREFQEKQLVEDNVNSSWAQTQPYVILISIDGFRYDYAEKYRASNILGLAENGVSAKQMLSSFPTKTFPNHYTIVTGQFPGTHGIVSNEFYSRSKDDWYAIRKKEAVQEASWYGGVPLWTLAERNEMLSASMFWVGSEAKIAGHYPTYRYGYDGRVPNEYRIRQMADWLKLPEEKRPHLILGYFSLVDDAGHRYGPDHKETKKAVGEIDASIGRLQKEIAELKLPVHLVLVSDHGMSAINRGLVLPELTDLGDSEVSYSFPPMIYQKDPAEVDRIYNELLKNELIDVYKRESLPGYLNFQNEDRVGELILITEAPTIILSARRMVSGGTHGFNPYSNREMGAIFYASGPLLKENLVIPPFQNVHIYPFISKMLNLPIPEEVEGSVDVLSDIFR